MGESGQDFKQTLSKVVQDRINQANGRLKAANVGVAIQPIGKRLYLQATLPPRPGRKTTRHRQQRIALGIHVNPAGVSLAEKEARKVGALVDCGQFDWEPYLKGTALQPVTVADWLTRFEAEFRETMKPVTWKTDYRNAFVKLPPDELLTTDLLKSVLVTTEANTRTRRRCSLAFPVWLSSVA